MVALDGGIREKALSAAKVLGRLGAVRAVYVFGSYAEGRADRWSDIDVAAFVEGAENWDMERRAKAMALVMMEAGADVEAHLFPASALAGPIGGSLAEYVLRHGICIE